MSADNGVYILQTKDQFRVIHAQAIENIYWNHLKRKSMDEPVSTRLVEYFGRVRYTRDKEVADRVANVIANETPILEYGIKTFYVNKFWKQIEREAKRLAVVELESLKSRQHPLNDHSIKKLEQILTLRT